MIYLLYGSDFNKAREKLREILSSQLKKNKDASYFKITPDNYLEYNLEELIGGAGLFQNKFVVVLDGLVSSDESKEKVLGLLPDFQGSQNIFVIIEESLKKEEIKKISKFAIKTQEFSDDKSKKIKKDDFNVFTLTDALGARDKKRLWVNYQRAIIGGNVPERLHGLFFWQIKAMLSARNSKSAADAGLNPFVYKKSIGFSKNFTKEELNELSSELVRIYHDSRRGKTEFDIALERFILNI
ncbi:MAG TPA: hypothetical protein VJC12_03225 [Candidatus Paceibacterota bacterium]